MKTNTKKLLALLLAICSLVTFAMPTVFATGETGEAGGAQAETPANLEVDFAEGFQNAGVTQLHSTNYVLDTACLYHSFL